MSEKYTDDADWATAAEQSSEDDEAQEGNVLAAEELSSAPAEHLAVHVVDDEDDEDDDYDDIDIDDPEADAIVNDALEIDQAAEADKHAGEDGCQNSSPELDDVRARGRSVRNRISH